MTTFLIDTSSPMATIESLSCAIVVQASDIARHVDPNLVADAMLEAYARFYVEQGGDRAAAGPILAQLLEQIADMIAHRDSDLGRREATLYAPAGRA